MRHEKFVEGIGVGLAAIGGSLVLGLADRISLVAHNELLAHYTGTGFLVLAAFAEMYAMGSRILRKMPYTDEQDQQRPLIISHDEKVRQSWFKMVQGKLRQHRS